MSNELLSRIRLRSSVFSVQTEAESRENNNGLCDKITRVADVVSVVAGEF